MATPTIDAGFPKHVFAASPASSSIASITTTGASLMVAVLHIDAPGANPTVTAAGGLTWTEQVHESAIGDTGHWVSVWTAPSAGALSAVTITFSYTGSNAGMLDIYSVSGSAASPIGASKTQDSNASAAPPQVILTAQASGSLIIGGFSNFAGAAASTALANTTLDQTNATADALASGHASTLAAGNITIGCSAPNATNSCCAALEILGTSSGNGFGKFRGPSVLGPGKRGPDNAFKVTKAFLVPDPPAVPTFWKLQGPAQHVGKSPVGRFRLTQPYFVPSSGGATQYTQSVDGTLTMAGDIVNQTSKILSGSMSSTGLLLKQTGKILAGALTSSGAIQKQTGKVEAGTLTSSGLLVKQVGKVLAGTLTSSGALAKQTTRALAGTLTSAGALVKRTGKILAGALTSSGALTAFKVALVSLAGTLTSSGTLTKQVGKNLAGTLASAGTLSKRIFVSMAGTLTSAGAFVGQKLGTTVRTLLLWLFDDLDD